MFIGGELTGARNLTEQMQTLRDKIAQQPRRVLGDDKEEMKKWVEDCFSLDYQLPF